MERISSARVSRSTGGLRVLAALAFIAAAGCHSLEVTNPNDPDLTRALSSGGDVQSLLGGAFNHWYHAMGDINPSVMVDVAADHFESAWGNWGMKQQGWEPRLYPLVNSHTDASDNYRNDIEEPWYNNYGALVSANLVILALQNGVKIPGPTDSSSNPMILAAARFMQGAALSAIALNYDSGYAFDETTDPATIHLVGRDSVQRTAMTKLDAAIALASGASAPWSIPESFLHQVGEAWSNTQLAQVANYWAARTLAYFPHNATENAAVNWGKVATYASKGISSGTSFDIEIIGDGPGTPNGWWNDHLGIATALFDWTRVNVRVNCLFDATLRCHRPNNGADEPIPQSADYRFNGDDVVGDNCIPLAEYQAITGAGQPLTHCTAAGGVGGGYFVYLPASGAVWTGYPASRGYWRFSNLAFVRYYDAGWDSPNYAVGNLPFVSWHENDLLWAEGLVRSGGSFATAAAKINASRATIGHLPALLGTETLAQMVSAIMYERGIQLYGVGPMVPWYDQRRIGPDLNPHYYAAANDSDQTGWTAYGTGLQPSTFRLFPVPQQELSLLGDSTYTYGGVGGSEPPAPPARGAVVARGGSIFGTTRDGRVITGPGAYNRISDEIMANVKKEHAALRKM